MKGQSLQLQTLSLLLLRHCLGGHGLAKGKFVYFVATQVRRSFPDSEHLRFCQLRSDDFTYLLAEQPGLSPHLCGAEDSREEETMKKEAKLPASASGRRSFLFKSIAAGAVAMGAGALRDVVSPAIAQAKDGLPAGDAAILRFLA